MSRPVVISGTDPTNPRSAADIVERLEQIQAGLINMSTELGRLQVFASGIREVLHYEQSMPDKRASLIAAEVAREIELLRKDVDDVAFGRAQRAINAVAGCGVNLRAKFVWRPAR